MTTATREPQLGSHVIFKDHQGLPKAAMVTATTDTIDPRLAGDGGQVPRLSPGEVCLAIFSPSGGVECRRHIREGSGSGEWQYPEDYQQQQNGGSRARR